MLAAIWTVSGAEAASLRCLALAVTVEAAEAADAERACRALAAAGELLQACGLVTRRSHTIHIVPRIEGGGGGCLARYHCDGAQIEVVGSAHLRRQIEDRSPLMRIEVDLRPAIGRATGSCGCP